MVVMDVDVVVAGYHFSQGANLRNVISLGIPDVLGYTVFIDYTVKTRV